MDPRTPEPADEESANRPEADPLNSLPRVKTPVLMLNGKYDYFVPVASSQEPFFTLLGTRTSDKKYIVCDGRHDVPRTELIKESLACWTGTWGRCGRGRAKACGRQFNGYLSMHRRSAPTPGPETS
ncbi:MAG: hypothetical protein ABMA00_05235 [Gemmatimonas sp.]